MQTIVKLVISLALSLSTLGYEAHAQTTDWFSGNWHVTWSFGKGDLSANMVLSESGGIWTGEQTVYGNPCLRVTGPVKIASLENDEMVLLVNLSQSLQGCPNYRMTFTKSVSDTMKGLTRDGHEVTAKRQK